MQRKSKSSEETEQTFHHAEESEQTFYDALDYWNEPDSVASIAMINIMNYSKAVKGQETQERGHETQEQKNMERAIKNSMKEEYEQQMMTSTEDERVRQATQNSKII